MKASDGGICGQGHSRKQGAREEACGEQGGQLKGQRALEENQCTEAREG